MPTPPPIDIYNRSFARWLEDVLLPGWFASRRWYARPQGNSVGPLYINELAIDDQGLLLALVDDGSDDDWASFYFIALLATNQESARSLAPGDSLGLIPTEFTSSELYLVEASATPEGRLALLRLTLGETEMEWGLGTVKGRIFELKNVKRIKQGLAHQSRRIGVEQSNTSLVYNDQVILKLLRRPGKTGEPNPDVEIPLALSLTTEEPLTPPVMGVIQAGDDSDCLMIGTLCRYLNHAETGWDMALRAATAQIQSGDITADVQNEHLSRDLAIRTAQLHLALARIPDNEAFKPVPIRADELRALGLKLGRWAEGVFDQLSSTDLDRLEPQNHALFRQIIENRERFLQPFHLLSEFKTENENQTFLFAIRHHGDYHLGQVLWADNNWQVIDFEGEPKRSIGERRQKAIALRDVAGMVRSFDYAQAVCCRNLNATAEQKARAHAWRDHVASIFSHTYFAMAGELENEIFPLVPESYGLRKRLLDIFTLEKNLYELIYELEYRPDWLDVPLGGLIDWLEE